MLLATTQVEDFDRFLEIFSTKGAEKRKQHGSKGSIVFRDPNEDDRVWVIFDWDEQGWQSFVSDPEVPPILRRPGTREAPGGAARRPVQFRNTEPGHQRTDTPTCIGKRLQTLGCAGAERRRIPIERRQLKGVTLGLAAE